MNRAGPAATMTPVAPEDVLGRIEGARLAELLAAYYAAQGFTVEHVGNESPHLFSPRSVGLKLRRDDQILTVECRAGNVRAIELRDIQRLASAMHAQHATGAIFVTAGEFSPRARLAGEQQPELQLIDHQLLRRMLGPGMIDSLQREYPPQPASHIGTQAVCASSGKPPATRRDTGDAAPSPIVTLLVVCLLLCVIWFTSR